MNEYTYLLERQNCTPSTSAIGGIPVSAGGVSPDIDTIYKIPYVCRDKTNSQTSGIGARVVQSLFCIACILDLE